MLPLTLAEPARFTRVRRLLEDSGYTTQGIRERFGIEFLDDYPEAAPEKEQPKPIASAFDLFLVLFFEGGLVSHARMDQYLGPQAFEDLQALGLLAPHSDDAWYATALLYPVYDVYVCSDRWTNPDGTPFEAFGDIVYSARAITTQRFLRLIPPTPCESMLDLCSGSAVFALIAAKRCKHVYAYDIAERSTHFGKFNCMLNGIENVTCATGDLYEPAGSMTYDEIIAHPPYVPVLKSEFLFYDGGEDGESILRRAVEELPKYLNPGGRFICSAMGSDRNEAPFEMRIREWLGAQAENFDIALLVRAVRDPQDYAVRNLIRGKGDVAELKQWEALFRGRHVIRLVYASMVIQRRAGDRPVFTIRRETGPNFRAPELAWMLNWETAATQKETLSKILTSRLWARPQTELHTKHELDENDWQPTRYSLETSYPCDAKAEVESWSGFLVGRARGQTGMQLLDELKAEEILHPETPPEEFADALTPLISGGFLESDAWPLPQRLGKARA